MVVHRFDTNKENCVLLASQDPIQQYFKSELVYLLFIHRVGACIL